MTVKPTDLKNDPHAGKILPVVCIGCFNEKGEVLLLKRKKPPFDGFWEYSGGRIEFGEKMLDAAKRELLEETRLKGRDFRYAGVFESFYPNFHRLLFVFACRVDSNAKIKLSEQSAYAWFKQLPKNVIPVVKEFHPAARKAIKSTYVAKRK